jgi:peroxiredoxin
VKSWASDVLSPGRRGSTLVRAFLALVMLGVLVWALPSRQAGQGGGHHAGHERALDAFERAGVTELREGQHGPGPFTLRALDGATVSLTDLTRDRLVVRNFWATWCEPCRLEMPTLESLWAGYRERGVTVVGISVDRGAPRGLIEPYVRTMKLTFPILLDPEMKTANAWRVTGLPATFVIRPGGEVAGFAFGAREWDSAEMRALLESLLSGARAPAH